MADNIEQVLQALGQMTEMLRLMAVNQEAQAQQAQHAAQQAQPGNRRGVGLDERYFRFVEKLESTTTGRTSASSLPLLLEQPIRKWMGRRRTRG